MNHFLVMRDPEVRQKLIEMTEKAFVAMEPRPYRISFGDGTVARNLGEALGIKGVYGREIPGGAAQMLRMPLNPAKELKSLVVKTLSNDVIIGLMAVTLQ